MRKLSKKDENDYKRMQIYFESVSKCKYCGHTQLIGRKKDICSWCGHYIYKNDLEEFKEKMELASKKEKKG